MGDEMVRRRAGYSEEVRRDAVSMVLELGMSKDEVCARFGARLVRVAGTGRNQRIYGWFLGKILGMRVLGSWKTRSSS